MHSINCLIKTSSNSDKQRPPSRTVTSSSKTCVTLMSSGLMLLGIGGKVFVLENMQLPT